MRPPENRGWVAYYRTVVSSRVFSALTEYLWKLTCKWACWSHPNKVTPPLDSYTVHLLSRQDGRCSLCGENLLTPDQPPQTPQGWERWFLWVTKKAIEADYLLHHDAPGTARSNRTHLVHATCHRAHPAQRQAGGTVLQLST